MRPNARAKLGFYPLPVAEGERLRNRLAFPQNACASVLDPCVGAGEALHLLTSGAKVERHGVELDANRAAAAQVTGIQTIQGNAFNTVGKAGSFSFLFLNPPYGQQPGRALPLFAKVDRAHWHSHGGLR